jgi:hypothetical protein
MRNTLLTAALLAGVIAAAALSGCVTSQEMEAQVSAKDASDCSDYGAQPGTDGYLQCRMLLRQQHVQQNEVAAAAAQAQFNQGIHTMACSMGPC